MHNNVFPGDDILAPRTSAEINVALPKKNHASLQDINILAITV
jgi:hypothetical protein